MLEACFGHNPVCLLFDGQFENGKQLPFFSLQGSSLWYADISTMKLTSVIIIMFNQDIVAPAQKRKK